MGITDIFKALGLKGALALLLGAGAGTAGTLLFSDQGPGLAEKLLEGDARLEWQWAPENWVSDLGFRCDGDRWAMTLDARKVVKSYRDSEPLWQEVEIGRSGQWQDCVQVTDKALKISGLTLEWRTSGEWAKQGDPLGEWKKYTMSGEFRPVLALEGVVNWGDHESRGVIALVRTRYTK